MFLCEDPNVGVYIDHQSRKQLQNGFPAKQESKLMNIGHWKCKGTNNPQHNAKEKCHNLIDIVGSKSSNKD